MTLPFETAACQRFSVRRIHLSVKLWAHCLLNFHCGVTIWGDYEGRMEWIRPGSWVITYSCRECSKPKE